MKPVSLAFDTDSKPAANARRTVHENEDVEKRRQILSFTAGEAAAEEKPAKARKVIPALANRLRTTRPASEDPAALGNLGDRFNDAEEQVERSDVYGLVGIRQQANSAALQRAKEARKLDVHAEFAEEPTQEAYEAMPVEDFGLALLRGMGVNDEDTVDTVQFVARPARMGLGVDPTKVATGGKKYKHLVGKDGSVKSVVREGDDVIDAATLGPAKGKPMRIMSGRHAGLDCTVREVDTEGREGMVLVTLLPSDQDVVLSANHLSEPGMLGHGIDTSSSRHSKPRVGDEPRVSEALASSSKHGRKGAAAAKQGDGSAAGRYRHAGKHKSKRDHEDKHKKMHERGREREDGQRHRRDKHSADQRASPHMGHDRQTANARNAAAAADPEAWLREGIRVRVVDKQSRCYYRKGTVADMAGRHTCALHFDARDGGGVTEGFQSNQLETVVSKDAQAPVLILRGKYAGQTARLLQKSGGEAHVELTEDRTPLRIELDDVADYRGYMHGEDF